MLIVAIIFGICCGLAGILHLIIEPYYKKSCSIYNDIAIKASKKARNKIKEKYNADIYEFINPEYNTIIDGYQCNYNNCVYISEEVIKYSKNPTICENNIFISNGYTMVIPYFDEYGNQITIEKNITDSDYQKMLNKDLIISVESLLDKNQSIKI